MLLSTIDKFSHQGFEIQVLEGDYLENGRPTPEALEFSSTLIKSLDSLRDYAASKFMSLYNESWSDEEIGPVDREQFVARLTNPRIVLMNEAGTATVYFQDGGMFAGHGIEVFVDRGIPVAANLVG
jgi:hypothetical protein